MKKEQSTKFLKLCLADALLKLLKEEPWEAVSVSAICETAGIGRTTYYRHFNAHDGKAGLLVYKLSSAWQDYRTLHSDDHARDALNTFLHFVYENRDIFRLLHQNHLTGTLYEALDAMTDKVSDPRGIYIRAFFTGGYFGLVAQWIKDDFKETPEALQQQSRDLIQQLALEKAEENK
jgi:AcrR family transcriptional regulator